ncbi:TPA-induced transmembrane protein [Varanus komodoensis]|uniref:TPA-induced transmembrane protein n=1 Tax=Varanus komodoensis TaxID=61221 RepID=A0A8D2Q492_VARKO|nr:TPA-induced transmembrane protein [Varanus komodoensis]XP_044298330.1 TPA-induced transmembrane protein [Varanus komodoensis]XP_044298331.1 TPA-induced transmembrane protein [Varanus komodoensis]XP_044298332.1 TPA-induced transmembrane protein [Varanus komodoensis]XP_044298333.1 TPA-induced transmembrane protein [Varanus komodoensis]XP_044298334.1 TPA-induced transmembrane protein [Varanus komodoensis]KAF7250932.1 TPA-induced transmembrane protein [Varanus komodoensis]
MNGRVPGRNPEYIECNVIVGEEREEESEPNLNEHLYQEVPGVNQRTVKLKCSQIVFWKCKLWMVLAAFVLILATGLCLILYSVIYTDEDEYWDAEAIANGNHHNFSGTLKVHCANNPDLSLSASAYKLLSESLNSRLTDVYTYSPALGRYFISADIISLSDNDSTVSYELCFSVPPETEEFMKYRMSKEFLINVLRQNIYDQDDMDGLDIPGCTNMTLDPTSLSLT